MVCQGGRDRSADGGVIGKMRQVFSCSLALLARLLSGGLLIETHLGLHVSLDGRI